MNYAIRALTGKFQEEDRCRAIRISLSTDAGCSLRAPFRATILDAIASPRVAAPGPGRPFSRKRPRHIHSLKKLRMRHVGLFLSIPEMCKCVIIADLTGPAAPWEGRR